MSGGNGVLRAKLEAAVNGGSLADLTVQAPANDPYRLDTEAGREQAAWFAEQVNRYVPEGTLHIRGLHYRILGVPKPYYSEPYTNTDRDYSWLCRAACAARWLHTVPFDRIRDERNDPPEVRTVSQSSHDGSLRPQIFRSFIHMPDLWAPSISSSALPPGTPQPFRIVFIGEKSSLRAELLPVVERVRGELILPSGECSDTLIEGMAGRAAEDPRPTVVLYFADFDPAGWEMPVHVARKLQALIDGGFYPDLAIRVFRVGLTFEHCVEFDLPSTPLKQTEKRGDRWRDSTGREQTELDALLGRHPGAIERIARQAVRPFFDPTLRRRAQDLAYQVTDTAGRALAATPEYTQIEGLLDGAWQQAESSVRAAVAAANEALSQAINDAEALLPEFEEIRIPPPEPILAEAPEPIFDSALDYVTATRKLIAHKSVGSER